MYSNGVLAFPVIQQPAGQPGYVSSVEGVVTEFSMASSQGVTGLLAHNYLSGRFFHDFELGDVIQIVYGDGTIRKYQVSDLRKYQALQPNSTNSRFVDLDSDQELSAEEQLSISFMFTLDLRNREFEYFQYKNGLLDEETWLSYRQVILINHTSELGRKWWHEVGKEIVMHRQVAGFLIGFIQAAQLISDGVPGHLSMVLFDVGAFRCSIEVPRGPGMRGRAWTSGALQRATSRSCSMDLTKIAAIGAPA